MEFLVTMATRVPEGTSDAAVDDIRAREATHSRALASEGRLLRLWRPPLHPGEWRTLGLFDAADSDALESVLRSMPLRVWRTDQAVPLLPHPNDPGPRREVGAPPRRGPGSEFFTTFTITVPPGTPTEVVEDTDAREAARAGILADQGRLRRLWGLPGEGRTLGLWWAADAGEMEGILESLPLQAWVQVETTQLAQHPSDPEGSPS